MRLITQMLFLTFVALFTALSIYASTWFTGWLVWNVYIEDKVSTKIEGAVR